MLDVTMDLEADLGIDSIKRVEILSAVRDRAPELPDVDTATLATLHTLGQVIDHLRASLGGAPAPAPSPAPVAVAAETTQRLAPEEAPELDLEALLITVVAEKTGYPTEMLAPTMDLEADLGIDSIKRVE